MTTAPDLLLTNASVEIQAAAADGKPPRVEIVAYNGNVMTVAGWGPVALELSAIELPPQVAILADHDATLGGIVGYGVASTPGGKLMVNGAITPSTEAAKQVIELSKSGFQFQASVGIDQSSRERIAPGKSVTVNGKTIIAPANGLTLVRGGKLREVSITARGSDSQTSVSIAASKRGFKNMEENGTQVIEPTPAVAVERERVATIVSLCAGGHVEIQATAIAQGWDVTRTEIEILRADEKAELQAARLQSLRSARATGPAIHSGNNAPSDAVLCASLCMSGGLSEAFVGKQYDERTMNEALGARRRGLGLHDAIFASIAAAGLECTSRRVTDDVLNTAVKAHNMLRASGSSTMSLPSILANVQNKFLLQGYENVARVWPTICRIVPSNDFKPMLRVRLVTDGTFPLVAQDGEITHGRLTDEGFANQVHTYGKRIYIDRQVLVNDDVQALQTVPLALGRDCALRQEEICFQVLLSNTNSFFSTDNGNYASGSGTALSLAALTQAETLFRNQTAPNGKPIMVTPAILLVPTTLAPTGRQLVRSTSLVGIPANNALAPSANPYASWFDVQTSPWLNSQSLTNSSTTGWYLFGAPGDVAALEMAFLKGQEGPPVIQEMMGEADFSHLGIALRAYSDFGCAYSDHRGALLMKGAA